MKERILFVCVGQGGGNIGQLFENHGYNCIFINTSNDDLETIQAKHKLHVVGAFGCNKDRQKALNYTRDYHQTMIDVIDNKFPTQDIIYFIFSLGGGTGSGVSPILLDLISQNNKSKHYGAVVILPSLKESIKSKINSIEAYQQIIAINRLKNLYVLDNNNEQDKFQINTKFFQMFDRLINITIPNSKGIVDKAELETILTCKGNAYLSIDIQSIFNDLKDNQIFTQYEYGCKYITLSLKDTEIDIETIERVVGTPMDTYIGYNDISNFISIVGSSYPKKRIEQLVTNVHSKHSDMVQINDTPMFNFDIPKCKVEPDVIKEINVDFNSIFAKYMD